MFKNVFNKMFENQREKYCCISKYHKKNIVKINCGHFLCIHCIKKILKNELYFEKLCSQNISYQCPLCKESMKEIKL